MPPKRTRAKAAGGNGDEDEGVVLTAASSRPRRNVTKRPAAAVEDNADTGESERPAKKPRAKRPAPAKASKAGGAASRTRGTKRAAASADDSEDEPPSKRTRGRAHKAPPAAASSRSSSSSSSSSDDEPLRDRLRRRREKAAAPAGGDVADKDADAAADRSPTTLLRHQNSGKPLDTLGKPLSNIPGAWLTGEDVADEDADAAADRSPTRLSWQQNSGKPLGTLGKPLSHIPGAWLTGDSANGVAAEGSKRGPLSDYKVKRIKGPAPELEDTEENNPDVLAGLKDEDAIATVESERIAHTLRRGVDRDITDVTLRFKLQVYTCTPARLFYRMRVFVHENEADQGKAAGHISAYRIAKPTATHPNADNDTWRRELMPAVQTDVREHEDECSYCVRALFNRTTGKALRRVQGQDVRRSLDRNALMHVALVYIRQPYQQQGLVRLLLAHFETLLSAGLPEWVAFRGNLILHPGLPEGAFAARTWRGVDIDQIAPILTEMYEKNGYEVWVWDAKMQDRKGNAAYMTIMGKQLNPLP